MRHIALLKRTLNSMTRYCEEVRGQAVEIGNLNERGSEQKCSQEHQNDTTVKGVNKLDLFCKAKIAYCYTCQDTWRSYETSVHKLNETA
jgi:hypothetical protein